MYRTVHPKAAAAQLAANLEMQRQISRQAMIANLEDGGYTVDSALPQPWVDAVLEATGISPVGHFVWTYCERAGVFGEPRPVTLHGRAIQQLLDALEDRSSSARHRNCP
jgi:hypothetical protein